MKPNPKTTQGEEELNISEIIWMGFFVFMVGLVVIMVGFLFHLGWNLV